ncbi:unnamed protein product [Adineta steineri]|uniref:G-protein coupled receptors family 1 profile domain-containing protein n=1 Tax=Adineta steineri TaxID=433720 RepID=A0A819K916_9BILA|nr:unnamed protein product [Adineta steineri]CAF3940476.1 unnamed protein product [Adineta steineri]
MTLNITTTSTIILSTVSNTNTILNILLNKVVYNLPLVFIILGLIGFLGNVFTYLQAELRSNTCSIYLLCGSIVDAIHLLYNLLAVYLTRVHGYYIPWFVLPSLCQFYISMLGFLPHLSINFLLMAIIDRYASTCNLASSIHRINQLKMVPWFIIITIFTSGLITLRTILLYEYKSLVGCTTTNPLMNSILYVIFNGVMQPLLMLIFVLLTFRNVQLSRQRIGTAVNLRGSRNRFITMIFVQVLATAIISLQWIFVYSLFVFYFGTKAIYDQSSVIYFVYMLSNYCCYLNNVKSFYVSLLISKVFRQTFKKVSVKFLPRYLRVRWETTGVNDFMMNDINNNQPNVSRKRAITREN